MFFKTITFLLEALKAFVFYMKFIIIFFFF